MGESVAIVGGGAAGFFAAIAGARAGRSVRVYERGARCLEKVLISGGGRCNVTHGCFDARALAARYPRGGRALVGAFERFGPRETMEWFESRGVPLKIEADGRVFPVTDRSQTIVDCLEGAARRAGVTVLARRGVERVRRLEDGGFELGFAGGESERCDRLLLATGGCRGVASGALAAALGHSLEPPVPSLFGFRMSEGWVGELAGVSVGDVELSIREEGLRERGPLLFTHGGLSGPAVLRLSAWGARALHARGYRFRLRISWIAGVGDEGIRAEIDGRRARMAPRAVGAWPLGGLPGRLWERLVTRAGISEGTRWGGLGGSSVEALVAALRRTELDVDGRSLNRDEFVTCGGVRLREVDFRTMASRVCPGLALVGELLDVDGVTGGFNFQAAWTTGWIAGTMMDETGA